MGGKSPIADSRKAPVMVGAGALAVFVALIAFGARGVRGTDQYWYLADLAMFRSGRGMVANWITPILWNPDAGFDPANLPPPVHHVPVTYFAAGIDAVVDNGYLAFVVCNALLAVAAALLVFVLARSLVPPTASAVAAGVFLVSPQTVWFTLNPLMEQSLVLAAVVLALGSVWVITRPVTGALVMAVGVAVLAVSRPTNLALIPCGIVLLCLLAWRARTSWWAVVLFTGVSAGLWFIGSLLLPSYPIFSVKAMLAINTAADTRGIGNNLAFCYTPEGPITPSLVLGKALSGLEQAVVPASAQELAMETATLALMVFGVVLGSRSLRGKVVAWWALSFFAVFLLTSALVQSQSRYLGPVLPLALVLSAKGLEVLAARYGFSTSIRRLAVVGFAIVFAATSVLMTVQYVPSAREASMKLAQMRAALGGPGSGNTLVLDAPGDGFPWEAASVIAPSLVVAAQGKSPETCVPLAEVERWQVTRVAVRDDWTDEQVQAAFCAGADGRTVALAPAGEGLEPLGRRLFTISQ